LPPKIAKSREIRTKFDLIAVQGHPKSSVLVSIKSSYATSYYSLIVTTGRICYRFRDIDVYSLKIAAWFFPPLTYLTSPLWRKPLEFLDETYPTKTTGMGLTYGENFMILSSTVLYDIPVWQTNERTR